MLPFKLVYSEKYFLPIGEHIFRADKYRLIRELLLREHVADESDFIAPQPASEADVLLVHSPLYVNKLMEGSLTAREELEMEIPYSPQVVDAFMLHTGGSILAAERALKDGVCINIGGGFHHAFPEHGEGFCMMHDFAVAIRVMQKRGLIGRAMTVDCDVHQGNGTAFIFGSAAHKPNKLPSWSAAALGIPQDATVSEGPSKDVFTISLHQENNYPFVKPAVVDRRQPARRVWRCGISCVAGQRLELRIAAVRPRADLLRGWRRPFPRGPARRSELDD